MTDVSTAGRTGFPESLTVAICDDDAGDRERLRQEIVQLVPSRRLQFAEYADGPALLAAAESFDLVFLDIIMDRKDGLETAREMRRRNDRSLIVFVTSSRKHLVSGYEVEAFRYLLKPYSTAELAAILEKALARLDARGLVVRAGSTIHRIPFADIRYIEAQGRRCTLFLTNGSKLSVGEGISQLERQLNQEILMRCQKSFIVNLGEIASICRYEATLKNGVVIPIGRRLWPAVQDRFISYLSLD